MSQPLYSWNITKPNQVPLIGISFTVVGSPGTYVLQICPCPDPVCDRPIAYNEQTGDIDWLFTLAARGRNHGCASEDDRLAIIANAILYEHPEQEPLLAILGLPDIKTLTALLDEATTTSDPGADYYGITYWPPSKKNIRYLH